MSHFYCFCNNFFVYLPKMNHMKNYSWISFALRLLADNIDAGNTYATEDEVMEIADLLGYIMNPESPLSKYEAIKLLNVSRATFDNKVKAKLLPVGRSKQGFKEKFWFKRDLVKFKDEQNVKMST